MNVLFISEHAVHIGGIGAVIEQLCRGLKKQGHNCYLYCSQQMALEPGATLFDGIHIGPLAAPARRTDLRQYIANRAAYREVAAFLQQWHIDLIHCHEVHRSLYTAGNVAHQPIVASSHGGVFHKRYKKPRVIAAYQRFAKRVYCVTVLNSAMEYTLKQRFGSMFKSVVVANGIADEWLRDEPRSSRDILLCVGRLSADKCYDLAIDAYAASAARHRYGLVIAGSGATREELEACARTQQLAIVDAAPPANAAANTVYFAGYQIGVNKKALFARARLLLHPSRFEAFGIVLLEAMAQYALPLCANLETYRSQFPPPEFYVAYVEQPLASEWARVIDHNSERPDLATLTSANQQAVQRFAWSRIYQQYYACYEAALAASQAPA